MPPTKLSSTPARPDANYTRGVTQRAPRLTSCVYCGFEEARGDICGWCRRERRTFVYFMEQRDGRAIKIGYTAAGPHGRLKNLVTGNPYGIRLLGFVEGWDKQDEARLHEKFAAHNIEREWFRPHDDIYAYIWDLFELGLFEKAAPEPSVVPF